MLKFSTERNLPDLTNPYLAPEVEEELRSIAKTLDGPFQSFAQGRLHTLKTLQYLLDKRYLQFNDLNINPEKFFFLLELFGLAGGGSFATLAGVQLLLGGGAISKLMSPKIGARLLTLIQKGKLLGCFCMTEMGHGSNVPGIETVAIYDETTGQFTIDNVSVVYRNGQVVEVSEENRDAYITACKMFIGNARDADFGIVFAQLVVKEKGEFVSKGPHAFYVPFNIKGEKALYPSKIASSYTNIEFLDIGEKFGLNYIGNYIVRFHGVKIPRENLMMHGLVSLSPEGIYIKLVPSPLGSLYSAIKYGRTLISCTSQSFIGLMFYVGCQLRNKALSARKNNLVKNLEEEFPKELSIAYPDMYSLSRWASIAVGLYLAKRALVTNIHTLDDATATGMKVFTTTLAENVYKELQFFTPNGFTKDKLTETFRDWVASCTYEGDNGVIPQKVIGDQLMHMNSISGKIKSKGKLKFAGDLLGEQLLHFITTGQSTNDVNFILDMLAPFTPTVKSILGLNSGDPIFNTMRKQTSLIILIFIAKLEPIMSSARTKEEKSAIFYDVWNNNQLLINATANVYSALFVLVQMQSHTKFDLMKNLYLVFRNEVYLKYYSQTFDHVYGLLKPLVIDGVSYRTQTEALLKVLAKYNAPTGEMISKLKLEQRAACEKIAPHFNEIIKAVTNNKASKKDKDKVKDKESIYEELIKRKFFVTEESEISNEVETVTRKMARL